MSLSVTKLQKEHVQWFDVDRYDGTKDWGVYEWAVALLLRRVLSTMVELEDIGQNKYGDLFAKVMTNPVPPAPRQLPRGVLSNGLRQVFDTEAIDIVEYFNWLKDDRLSDVMSAATAFHNACEDGQVPEIPPLLTTGFSGLLRERLSTRPQFENVQVNLGISDEQLIEDFRAWLAEKRGKLGQLPLRCASPADMQSWHQYKVLAFIDLEIFTKKTRTETTNAFIGDLLFPDDEVDRPERVRKVVRPLAHKLMQSQFISALDEQAARAE